MKILYWETAFNQSVLYSSLAKKDLIKIAGSIF